MIRLLQWLIYGHVHEWEIVKEVRFNYSNDWGDSGTCTKYTLRCKQCGEMKTFVDKG